MLQGSKELWFSHSAIFSCRKQSKKKKKSKKNNPEQSEELPPIAFKGSRKGFNLNESLRGYRSLTDEEQKLTRSEPRGDDSQRDEPRGSRKGSYKQLNEELVDEVFGDSPEKRRKKSGKKHRRRRTRDEDDAAA